MTVKDVAELPVAVRCLIIGGLFVVGANLPAEAQSRTRDVSVDHPVFAFVGELTGHRCEIRETWPNGQPFRLDKEFAWDLEGRIVTMRSYSVDDNGDRTPRNLGIRAYDEESSNARYWEFDRLGNVTEGPVWVEDGVLYYEYPYGPTGQILRDSWKPLGQNVYAFKVREWNDGEWGRTYMDGTYRCNPLDETIR